MSNRFYSQTPVTDRQVVLEGPEAHHLVHVMRIRTGSEIVLFDGSGTEFCARVMRTGRSDVELEILSRSEVDRELSATLTLGVSLPKGDRQKWLVEKLVELGVRRLVPLQSERAVAQPTDNALDRLGRTVIEASKQCGRNVLMKIHESQDWQTFVGTSSRDARRIVAHPDQSARYPATNKWQSDNATDTIAAIGPEGGFSPSEVALAVDGGWSVVDLGPRIFRTETAAVALASLFSLRSTTNE